MIKASLLLEVCAELDPDATLVELEFGLSVSVLDATDVLVAGDVIDTTPFPLLADVIPDASAVMSLSTGGVVVVACALALLVVVVRVVMISVASDSSELSN